MKSPSSIHLHRPAKALAERFCGRGAYSRLGGIAVQWDAALHNGFFNPIPSSSYEF